MGPKTVYCGYSLAAEEIAAGPLSLWGPGYPRAYWVPPVGLLSAIGRQWFGPSPAAPAVPAPRECLRGLAVPLKWMIFPGLS